MWDRGASSVCCGWRSPFSLELGRLAPNLDRTRPETNLNARTQGWTETPAVGRPLGTLLDFAGTTDTRIAIAKACWRFFHKVTTRCRREGFRLDECQSSVRTPFNTVAGLRAVGAHSIRRAPRQSHTNFWSPLWVSCGNAGTRFQQARSREASASERCRSVESGLGDLRTRG